MTAQVIEMPSPASQSNKAAFADLLKRTRGGAARVLNRSNSWLRGLLKSTRLSRVLGFIGRWVGVARSYVGRLAQAASARWGLGYALTTGKGRALVTQGLKTALKPAAWVLGKGLNLLRRGLAVVHAEAVIDVPLSYAIQYGTAAYAWTQKNVMPYLKNARTVAGAKILTGLGLLRSIRGFKVIGALARFNPFIVGAIWTLVIADMALSSMTLVGDKLPAPVQRTVARVEDWLARRTPSQVHDEAAKRVDLHIAHGTHTEPATKEAHTPVKADREVRVERQMALLDQMGGIEYAKAIHEQQDGIEVFTEVMSKNAARRLLEENNIPVPTARAKKHQ